MSITFSEKYYTTQQAAKLLSVTADTVKRYCNSARLSASKVGNSWMIPHSAIEAYVESAPENGRPRNKKPSRKRRT